MKKRKLFWILLPSYWILTLVAIVAVALYAYHAMSNLYFQTLENDIRTRAMLMADQALPFVQAGNSAELDALCKRQGATARTRFTVIMPDGQVVADSEKKPDEMEYHGDRPEIRQALGGQAGIDLRYSRTIRQEMMYIAIPLKDANSQTLCAIRASLPMTAIEAELNRMTLRMGFATLLTGILAMGVCTVVVRRITTPLRGIGRAARLFAEGDFSHRIAAQQAVEFDQLAEALNTMSEQLSKTLSTLSEQRNEQEAVLSSMNEGVMAIDRKERIIHINRVAGEILDLDPEKVKKELVQQAIRYANLQEFIKAVLGSQKPLARDLSLLGQGEKQLQANGTVLRGADGASLGALIVLRDVTQLRHLETVRSDFVANVSHELKTPITSIKGFVETLLSDEWKHEPDILRFLEIISQQASRLNAIIDDLLTLSRLEQKEGLVMKEPCRISAVIENAVYLCQLQAQKKSIRIATACPDGLMLNVNGPLIEQALVNLIINAIKYSEDNKSVHVEAEEQEQRVLLTVRDKGFGIERKHLDRLFERFYRVDTARSRKLGGTGLGLSIVKHIVQAHGGTIRVDSKVGVGSVFTIALPKELPANEATV